MLNSFFESAASLSVGLQSVQENLPDSVKSAWGASYTGIQSLKEGVNARIGERRKFRTKTGSMEVVELGSLSENVTKVRCCATDTEFVLKRVEVPMQGEEPGSSSPASMTVTISLEALQTLVGRTELIKALPESPHLVRCLASQADNSGKAHAQLLLFELCEEPLDDLVARSGGTLKVQEALQVLEDVAAGLHSLHTSEDKPEGKPVIHGSVRAEHVFCTKSGTWKLGSFGAAEAGEQPDVASDVLQLGVLIFKLLFGCAAEVLSGLDSKSALPVPNGRPADALEGRLCLLLRWMLAADPVKRPTAKQVGVIVESLRSMPAVELIQAMPPWVRTAAKKTCEELMVKILVEAISNIDGSDRRILVNKYGEEALMNPTLLPPTVQVKALNHEQSARMRDLPIFLGDETATATNEAKELGLKLAQAGSALQSDEAPQLIQCADLMDMTQDLIDLPDDTKNQPAELNLMDMFDPITAPVVGTQCTPVVGTQCTEPPDLL